MGSPEPPRWKDDMGDYHDPVPPDGTCQEEEDEWVMTTEKAGPTCPFGHPWDVMERVNELERENERLDRCFAREQDIADNFTERVNQLEKAYDLLASAYAHLEGGQRAKAERLRAAAQALSANGSMQSSVETPEEREERIRTKAAESRKKLGWPAAGEDAK